jgi:DNA-binding XRE family transcriptional regulator
LTFSFFCGIIFAIKDSEAIVEKPHRSPKKHYMNSLKKHREKVLMSKAELARKAGLSALTIDRIEKGKSCRLETKRKIILALGLQLSERGKIFGDDKS